MQGGGRRFFFFKLKIVWESYAISRRAINGSRAIGSRPLLSAIYFVTPKVRRRAARGTSHDAVTLTAQPEYDGVEEEPPVVVAAVVALRRVVGM